MKREITPVTENEYGDETHPSFGMISASRVSSSPAHSLFDSEIKHRQYIVLEIGSATRKRDLGHDHIHGMRRKYISVALSEAQWASFVSSLNTTGVPCTIESLPDQPFVPAAPFEPRLRLSHQYATEAADKAFEKVREAFVAVKEKPSKANLRALEIALEHVGPNVEYAAKTLSEHAENVVTKARADIEAMVVKHAATLGIEAANMPKLLAEENE